MFLLTRFWQRGAATTLALDYPMPDPIPDPIPDPEPASPSLDEPDPGVFHHTPRGHRPNNRNQPPNPPTG